MHRLIWKFWLAICLALAAMIGLSALLVSQWHRFESYSQAQARPDARLQTLANQLEQNLLQDLPVTDLLLHNSMSEFGETFLIDSHGADFLKRSIPSEILGSEPVVTQSDHSPRQPPSIFARAVSTDEGVAYFMIFQFHNPGHPLWQIYRQFGLTWVLLGTLLISGLIATGLAMIVARPLGQLAKVSERHSEGDLNAPIGQALLLRRDEVGELARRLSASATKINQLMHRQREFFRDISHEVRAPLARLQLAAESIEISPHDQKAQAQLQREVTVIDELVQGLLKLSRTDPQIGMGHFDTAPFSNILQKAVSNVEIVADRKSVTIESNISAGDEHSTRLVQGDIMGLTHALENVLTNAIRYTPSESHIILKYTTEKGNHKVEIQDEGPGVASENLRVIFEPFVRLDNSRRRDTGGFGIGLALVKRIVTQHGGSVCARNQKPHGLTVTLVLPFAKITVADTHQPETVQHA